MSPEVIIEGLFIVFIVIMTVSAVDITYVAWKYRKKALETDWENQFQVQRFVNELIYDEKIAKGIKKGFLVAVAEDCRVHGYDELAEKAERKATEL